MRNTRTRTYARGRWLRGLLVAVAVPVAVAALAGPAFAGSLHAISLRSADGVQWGVATIEDNDDGTATIEVRFDDPTLSGRGFNLEMSTGKEIADLGPVTDGYLRAKVPLSVQELTSGNFGVGVIGDSGDFIRLPLRSS